MINAVAFCQVEGCHNVANRLVVDFEDEERMDPVVMEVCDECADIYEGLGYEVVEMDDIQGLYY